MTLWVCMGCSEAAVVATRCQPGPAAPEEESLHTNVHCNRVHDHFPFLISYDPTVRVGRSEEVGAQADGANLHAVQHWTTAPPARSGCEIHAVPPKGPIKASGTAAADTCRPA